MIAANLAYACMQTVPNVSGPALDLVASLAEYVDLQSTLVYLADPPPGYLFPATDIKGGLSQIAANVAAEAYASELDFQNDIYSLVVSARDRYVTDLFLMRIAADGTQATSSGRETRKVSFRSHEPSISSRYLQTADNFPKFLFLVSFAPSLAGWDMSYIESDDLLAINADGTSITPAAGTFTPSPVLQIDGIDVVTFLEAQSLLTRTSQDPDALYNLVSHP